MGDGDDDEQVSSGPHASNLCGTVGDEDDQAQLLNHRNRNFLGDFETCSKLEDLNLDVRQNSNGISRENPAEDLTRRKEALRTPIHEVIFSTVDKPKLLSQGTESLYEAMIKAIARSKGSWSGSSHSQTMIEKTIAAKTKCEDWEIDWRLLKIGEKIAAGSCGDLLVQSILMNSFDFVSPAL